MKNGLPPRTDLRSRSLDLLRFPLALFVVAVHVFAPLPFVDSTLPSAQGLYHFIVAFVKDQSVPVYFFIAGYVFFLGLRLTFHSYGGKLQRRCRSLLIPYLAWNIIAVLYALKAYLGDGDTSAYHVTLQSLAACFWDDSQGILPYTIMSTDGIFPIDKPLWFVRDLMLLAIASPAIYGIYRLGPRVAVSILAVVTVVWSLRIMEGHLAQLTEGFVFFAWGGLVSYHKRDMMAEFDRFFTASMILYPLLATVILIGAPYFPVAAIYVKSINIVVGLFFFYNISALLVRRFQLAATPFLTSASFFVYCGHFILLDPVTRRMAAVINPESNVGVLGFYALSYVVIIALLLVIFALLRRFSPPVLALFTGGRR